MAQMNKIHQALAAQAILSRINSLLFILPARKMFSASNCNCNCPYCAVCTVKCPLEVSKSKQLSSLDVFARREDPPMQMASVFLIFAT